MATRSYSRPGKGKPSKNVKSWDSSSSELFDEFVSEKSKKPSPKASPLVRSSWSKASPNSKRSPAGSKTKGGEKSPAVRGRVSYEYSYSPGSRMSGGAPVSVPSNYSTPSPSAKRKILQKMKVFDFDESEEEEDEGVSSGKRVKASSEKSGVKRVKVSGEKTGAKRVKRAGEGGGEKGVKRARHISKVTEQLSDGNQPSDSDYSSQDSLKMESPDVKPPSKKSKSANSRNTKAASAKQAQPKKKTTPVATVVDQSDSSTGSPEVKQSSASGAKRKTSKVDPKADSESSGKTNAASSRGKRKASKEEDARTETEAPAKKPKVSQTSQNTRQASSSRSSRLFIPPTNRLTRSAARAIAKFVEGDIEIESFQDSQEPFDFESPIIPPSIASEEKGSSENAADFETDVGESAGKVVGEGNSGESSIRAATSSETQATTDSSQEGENSEQTETLTEVKKGEPVASASDDEFDSLSKSKRAETEETTTKPQKSDDNVTDRLLGDGSTVPSGVESLAEAQKSKEVMSNDDFDSLFKPDQNESRGTAMETHNDQDKEATQLPSSETTNPEGTKMAKASTKTRKTQSKVNQPQSDEVIQPSRTDSSEKSRSGNSGGMETTATDSGDKDRETEATATDSSDADMRVVAVESTNSQDKGQRSSNDTYAAIPNASDDVVLIGESDTSIYSPKPFGYDFQTSTKSDSQSTTASGSQTSTKSDSQSMTASGSQATTKSDSQPMTGSSSHDLEPEHESMEESDTQNVDDSTEGTPDLSLNEPVGGKAFQDFDRHLAVPTVKRSYSGTSSPGKPPGVVSVPSLTRSSTWPKSYSASGTSGSQKIGVRCSREEKELVTVVRNVKQAHECLELGESQQFFDEMEYLLDSITPEQPIAVRCLGTCNLATHCLNPDFCQQIRAHGFTSKIVSQLKDCLQHPGLCLSTAVLLYVMTRDQLNSDWSKSDVGVMVEMLGVEGEGGESSGKPAREFARIKAKARSVLEKVCEVLVSCEKTDSTDQEESTPGGEKRGGREDGSIDLSNITVRDLSRESLLSLSSPHTHTPHWLREELRVSGGLDHFANWVIGGYDELKAMCAGEGGASGKGEGVEGEEKEEEGVERRLKRLERELKLLENATLLNKDNQSYLIVFDGSLLVSQLVRLLPVCQTFAAGEELRSVAVPTLLGVMKVLLNLTHDSELGSHRVGEQNDVLRAILNVIFQLPDSLPEEHHFDTLVLGLGLLINLTEHSSRNRKQLEAIDLQLGEKEDKKTEGEEEDDVISGCRRQHSTLRALTQFFMKHYSKAEAANIEVPQPQRLSQLNPSPHSSPHLSPRKSSLVQGRLTPTFAARMRMKKEGRSHSKSPRKPAGSHGNSQGSQHSQEEEGDSEGVSDDEEFESIQMDPLVFSREEFDTALNQAGKHMEDSIVASYTALLLGILARHNPDAVDVVRGGMPSRGFSEMIAVLRKFVSFMNITGSYSGSGLDSIRHIIKYLEAL